MVRAILEAIAFFLMPFAGYIGYLVLRQRYPFEMQAWSRATLMALSIVGLAMAGAAIFGFGLLAKHYTGAYVPAHIENGRLVPGRFL